MRPARVASLRRDCQVADKRFHQVQVPVVHAWLKVDTFMAG